MDHSFIPPWAHSDHFPLCHHHLIDPEVLPPISQVGVSYSFEKPTWIKEALRCIWPYFTRPISTFVFYRIKSSKNIFPSLSSSIWSNSASQSNSSLFPTHWRTSLIFSSLRKRFFFIVFFGFTSSLWKSCKKYQTNICLYRTWPGGICNAVSRVIRTKKKEEIIWNYKCLWVMIRGGQW